MVYNASRLPFLALAVLAGAALFAACGGGDDEQSSGNNQDGVSLEKAFDVSLGDNFFDPQEFKVPEGIKVTFNIKNDGAALHNMRIAGPDNEFNTDDDTVSGDDFIAGGDEASFKWTAPDDQASIKVQCDIHPTDMTGTIVVES